MKKENFVKTWFVDFAPSLLLSSSFFVIKYFNRLKKNLCQFISKYKSKDPMENNTNAANCLLLLYAFNTAKNVKRTRYADVAVQLYYIYLGVCIV